MTLLKFGSPDYGSGQNTRSPKSGGMALIDITQYRPKPYHLRYSWQIDKNPEPAIPSAVLAFLRRTQRLYRFWWFSHYTIGLTGVVAGTLLTAISGASTESQYLSSLREFAWLIGIIAAVSTSLVTFLGPLHKAERYWSAFHHLEQACLEFEGRQMDNRMRKLMRKVMEARLLLQVADKGDELAGFAKHATEQKSDLSQATV